MNNTYNCDNSALSVSKLFILEMVVPLEGALLLLSYLPVTRKQFDILDAIELFTILYNS